MAHRSTLLTRLDKIKAAVIQMSEDNKNLREKLRKRDEPLVEKVKKLEDFVRTQIPNERARHEAEIRVLKKIIEKDEKQIRDDGLQADKTG
jgi:cell division protein FtsB